MTAEEIIKKIIEFMKQAGELAIGNQDNIDFFDSKLKHGGVISVVTKTDIAISGLFKEFVEREFAELKPLIVDEESVADLGDNPLAKVKDAEYSFIIDPIDGTLPYSARMPLYGISVGVFKKGKPYVGAIYAPRLGDLVYADDKRVYSVENAFRDDEKVKELKAFPDDVDNEPLFFYSPTKVKLNNNWSKKDTVPVDLYSAVLDCLGMAKGQGRGYYFKAYLWDIAGSLPIFDKLGLKVLDMENGEELAPVDDKVFNGYLKTSRVYIVCRPRYFEYLRRIVDNV